MVFVLIPVHFAFLNITIPADYPEIFKGHGEPWILRSGEFVIDGSAIVTAKAAVTNGTVLIGVFQHPGFTFGGCAAFVAPIVTAPEIKLSVIDKILLCQTVIAPTAHFIGELKEFLKRFFVESVERIGVEFHNQ